jgi:hypothetical protein
MDVLCKEDLYSPARRGNPIAVRDKGSKDREERRGAYRRNSSSERKSSEDLESSSQLLY